MIQFIIPTRGSIVLKTMDNNDLDNNLDMVGVVGSNPIAPTKFPFSISGLTCFLSGYYLAGDKAGTKRGFATLAARS